jgi:hypothetical protein
MKKVTLLLVGVFASVLTFGSMPYDDPKTSSGMVIVRSNQTSYKLIYKSELKSDVKIEIFNRENVRVFSEVIEKSDGFARPYSFASLPEGKYTIRLDNGSNWLTETVDYRTPEIPKYAHVATLKDGKYLFTLSSPSFERFDVTIFDDQGEKIFREHNIVSGNFARLYNMTGVQGPFTFEIVDRNGDAKTLVK